MSFKDSYEYYEELCTGDFAFSFYSYGYREAVEIKNLFDHREFKVDYKPGVSTLRDEDDPLLNGIIDSRYTYRVEKTLENVHLYNQVKNIYMKEYPLAPFPLYEKRKESTIMISTQKGISIIVTLNVLSKDDLIKYVNYKLKNDYGLNEVGKTNYSLCLVKSSYFLNNSSLYDSFFNDIKNYSLKLFKESLEKDWYEYNFGLIPKNKKQEFIEQGSMVRGIFSETPIRTYSVLFNKIKVLNTVGSESTGEYRETMSLKVEFCIKLMKYIFNLAEKYCSHLKEENIIWRVEDEEIKKIYNINNNYDGPVIIQQFLVFLVKQIVDDILDRDMKQENPTKGIVFSF